MKVITVDITGEYFNIVCLRNILFFCTLSGKRKSYENYCRIFEKLPEYRRISTTVFLHKQYTII